MNMKILDTILHFIKCTNCFENLNCKNAEITIDCVYIFE